MARDGSKEIAIHSSKLPDENLKYRIFDFATRVTNYSKLSATMRAETIQLCAQILFYDHGYKAVAGISKLDSNWRKRMEASYQNGDETHPLRGLYKGSKKYTDKFDAEHPGGVLKYFRYAQMILGNQASYEDIAKVMNNKANTDGVTVNGNPPKFNSKNVYRWFKLLGGKEKSPIEKPHLTPEMKEERKKWCEYIKTLIAEHGDQFYACYLDEKWFYTTSRRRRMKILKAQPGKDPEEVQPIVPTTRSRRFPVKSMYLGVVAKPCKANGFDGKIFLKRISETIGYTRMTHNQNFSDSAAINGMIRRGEWYSEDLHLVTDGMTLGDVRENLKSEYYLEDEVAKRLVIQTEVNGKKITSTMSTT